MDIKTYSINPLVAIIDDFITEDIAQHIINLGKDDLTPTTVTTPDAANMIDSRCKSLSTQMVQWEDPILTKVTTDIADIVRLPPENAEPCKLLHYQGEQDFVPHSDAFHKNKGGIEQMTRGGQRLFSSMIYLNDCDGGQTTFPALKMQVMPKMGRLLIFANTMIGSIDHHPHGIHGALSVNSGEKWAIHFGWRQLAYHKPRVYPENSGEMVDI
ncbi:hypothetical protein GCM10007939_12710 [Amylibacter marinus]|uniref:Fe2OG dioxygenase domain-containing protein n=1 Tax=Amylibacter marinus TaxID=1475483 RepID=A0ABQ5VU69_9RHOB|nr:2OG-Fe(II) oxygenase [Amylibacter marinus]GLQ34988.1 hypothetical protein GCM10007939_12710 [Amylibacter marinus]